MTDKRIKVWVQRFKDRARLMLQWLDPDTGRRKSQSAGTNDPDDAEQARSDLEYELNHGRHQRASRMTWGAFRDLFEAEYLTNLRDGTREHYRYVLDLFERLCSPASLRGVTERTVSAFAAGMRSMKARGKAGGLASSTVREALKSLRAALGWAVEQKMLPAVPRFPAVKVPRKKPQPVPAEAFERLLAAAPDDQMRAYLSCGWLAGLRLREALRLEWDETDAAPWLDFGRSRVVLPAGFVKSDADQWLPIDPALRSLLEQLPRVGPRVFNFAGKRGPLTLTGVSQRVINLAKKAGVRLTMHTLRKGFGCRYAGKVPAQVLQKLMRHASIKTTMDYYANIDAAVEEAVLGQQCNSSRNTGRDDQEAAARRDDANPCRD